MAIPEHPFTNAFMGYREPDKVAAADVLAEKGFVEAGPMRGEDGSGVSVRVTEAGVQEIIRLRKIGLID